MYVSNIVCINYARSCIELSDLFEMHQIMRNYVMHKRILMIFLIFLTRRKTCMKVMKEKEESRALVCAGYRCCKKQLKA
ncbi:hypothetical protein GOP47_0013608 [Adiantum capillus-veneris]|uniref:Uncharacterized protein n=1 Tax=Adiantum capillus-veneris TaxID=13818 RepID=A0A9D4UPC5_ADICA|nr:hypothetical protein GOP47_0013608 [Adiantum capillus-veneris]